MSERTLNSEQIDCHQRAGPIGSKSRKMRLTLPQDERADCAIGLTPLGLIIAPQPVADPSQPAVVSVARTEGSGSKGSAQSDRRLVRRRLGMSRFYTVL
jgi:hypothetical protein